MPYTYQPNTAGHCPHCGTSVRFEAANPGSSPTYGTMDHSKCIVTSFSRCPECEHVIVVLLHGATKPQTRIEDSNPNQYLVWPRAVTRFVPPEVPPHIREEYNEATECLTVSQKASAALARRCLQFVLVEAGHAKKSRLVDQIDEVLPTLPDYVANSLHTLRHIGNLAAHPTTDPVGAIVDVAPEEAEWSLQVLDDLFDHYYVKPATAAKRKAELDKRLKNQTPPTP